MNEINNEKIAMILFGLAFFILLSGVAVAIYGITVAAPASVARMEAGCAKHGMKYASGGYRIPTCLNAAGQTFDLEAMEGGK